MSLHPQAKNYVQWMIKNNIPPLSTLSPQDARVWDAKVTDLLTKKSQWSGKIENMSVPAPGPHGAIQVRIYAPSRSASHLLLYFHGGGWVLGNLDAVDYPCRLLATGTGRVVVSVDYRLAPENKFPAAVEDCYNVSRWVAENAAKIGALKEKMAVCGDSAGGNLAAAVSLMAKDRHEPPIASQILIYPITDLTDSAYMNYPDDSSPALTRADMNWFIGHYIARNDELRDQYASPISRSDLTGLPSALLITAEYDILTKQCKAYADRLREAGVHVSLAHYPGLVHGFFTLPDVFDDAHDAVNQIAKELSNVR